MFVLDLISKKKKKYCEKFTSSWLYVGTCQRDSSIWSFCCSVLVFLCSVLMWFWQHQWWWVLIFSNCK